MGRVGTQPGKTKEVDHEQQWRRQRRRRRQRQLEFSINMAQIPYYERDFNIIERVKVYKYTNTRANK